MSSQFPGLPSIVVLAFCLAFCPQNADAAGADPDGRLYLPTDSAMADVDNAISRAGDAGKRGLVVLGANWCHDSRALAARLNESPLAEVVEDNYELVFVDVGFYEHGTDVLQAFDVPQLYATPTVLIVDPSTRQLVDNEERHLWRNADRVDMKTSVEFFEKWATEVVDAPETPVLQRIYAEIGDFERQLAARVAAGYAIVGPKLRARTEGNSPEDFDASWDELASLRMAIPGAMKELRDEARRRVVAGEEDIVLEFPEFPLLTWEAP
ncbi:MAG: thioredoxin family protein [Pseudomonadota bacterium]